MAKPYEKKEEKPETVRFRFTCEHTHTHMGLPFSKGDEINIDPAWADVIEAMGSGHRLTDKE
jgi:hypothetical protein